MVDTVSSETMYATKRRRRSVKTVKAPMKDPPKSNPSKRHRERLNGELDHLASLLPFEQSVISKLDRLSILRLAVSYLRTKSFFQAALHERYAVEGHHHLHHSHLYAEPGFTDTDSVLQALNGFMFVVTCDGEVFFASRTVEQYLGFHQSDIIHQSALELIHSEDREEFKTQLNWRSQLPADLQDCSIQQALMPENSQFLYRSFTVRFRCLLDNTSGFITLEINGHMRLLHGQCLKGDQEPEMALFAICCPFGPLPLLDVPARDYTFKTKHKMDMAPISMDHRGKLLFGYSDHELQERGGYDLIHPDDLNYYAAAHQELIKTGSSGLIAYRLLTKDFRWLWLQTSSKVIYKNSKPDFVICTHRHLTDDEGRDLVGKRGSEFKLPYPIIDTDTSGLGCSLEEEANKLKSPRGKKSKTQLRDYLHTGRKRKTPYREAFNGLNGYNPYAPLNGYPTCQPTEMKPDIMYPYGSQNFALDTSELYRSGYHPLAGSMYGTGLEADKHGYAANGYYLEPRQYQHTLQYHANGYTDLMANTAKYSYDMASKYGYDMPTGYGLDLSKRPYDEDLTKYDTDYRRYTHDYTSDKISRVNSLDPFKTSALYGTTPLQFNNESYLTGNVSAGGMGCTLNRADGSLAGTPTMDMTSMAKDNKVSKLTPDPLNDSESKPLVQNGHASVIRNASPRSKSPRTDRSCSASSAIYNSDGTASSTSWPTCDKSRSQASPQMTSMPTSTLTTHVASNLGSRIMSPMSQKTSNDHVATMGGSSGSVVALSSISTASNASPAAASTVTSVIQQPGRARSYDRQSPATGGIAVPVVKSSSWLHHPLSTTSSYDWHLNPASDTYSCHQRALRTGTDIYAAGMESVQNRGVIEGAKPLMGKVGERPSDGNPLLSFSQVTHTLLNGD